MALSAMSIHSQDRPCLMVKLTLTRRSRLAPTQASVSSPRAIARIAFSRRLSALARRRQFYARPTRWPVRFAFVV